MFGWYLICRNMSTDSVYFRKSIHSFKKHRSFVWIYSQLQNSYNVVCIVDVQCRPTLVTVTCNSVLKYWVSELTVLLLPSFNKFCVVFNKPTCSLIPSYKIFQAYYPNKGSGYLQEDISSTTGPVGCSSKDGSIFLWRSVKSWFWCFFFFMETPRFLMVLLPSQGLFVFSIPQCIVSYE